MREIEIVAQSQEEAIKIASEKEEVPESDLEVIEEYVPDEIDLKQLAEEKNLEELPSPESYTLYLIRYSFNWYVNLAEEWTQGLIERFAEGGKATADRFKNIIIVRLDIPETSILIGKRGATLDALQHVVVRALLTLDDSFPDVMLDVEGYREKKLQRLEREAKRAAERATRSGRPVSLSPMTPAERKFIHKTLSDFSGVKTESRGQDRSRHVVVESLNPSPRGRRRGGGGGGGGQRRGGQDRGNYSAPSPRKKPNNQQITDEQRAQLYGNVSDPDEQVDTAVEGKDSLLPNYLKEKDILSDNESGDEYEFNDEIE